MAVRHPYQPMHPPQKEVSFDRMAEILAKHAKPQVDVAREVPRNVARIIEWERPEPMSRILHSKCGRFRIRKWSYSEAIVAPSRWRYQAEYLVPDTWWYAFSPVRDSGDECKADCEEFASARAAK